MKRGYWIGTWNGNPKRHDSTYEVKNNNKQKKKIDCNQRAEILSTYPCIQQDITSYQQLRLLIAYIILTFFVSYVIQRKDARRGCCNFPVTILYSTKLHFPESWCHLQESIGSTLLFSHFRPRDGTPENWLFPMHVHPRAYVCVIYETAKGKFSGEHRTIAWWRHSTTYTYQNLSGPSVVVFLCKFNKKAKKKWILVLVVKFCLLNVKNDLLGKQNIKRCILRDHISSHNTIHKFKNRQVRNCNTTPDKQESGFPLALWIDWSCSPCLV